MKKRLNDTQLNALIDAVDYGELSRITAHDNFEPGGHRGQTIKSLIDLKLFEVIEFSRSRYPIKVKPTPRETWSLQLEKDLISHY